MKFSSAFNNFIKLGLTLNLAFPANVFALKLSRSNEMDNLLDGFTQTTFSTNDQEALNLLGRRTQDFISNKDNAALMTTPQGKELLGRQRKLINYLAVKKSFEKCAGGRRNLGARILNAIGNSEIADGNCDLKKGNDEILDFKNIANFISQKADSQSMNSLQDLIHEQALKNAVSTFLDLKYKYDESVDSGSALALCYDSKDRNVCSSRESQVLVEHGEKYLNDLKANAEKKLTHDEAARQINSKLVELNQLLKKVPIGVDQGLFNNWLINTSDPRFDDEANRAFADYVGAYERAASSGSGLLLMTETLRDKAGGLQDKNNVEEISDTAKNTTRYAFKAHKSVNANDIRAAIKEAKNKILEQAQTLHQMNAKRLSETDSNNAKNRMKDIKKLTKANPFALGQVLVSHPEYAKIVCQAINEIETDDQTKEKLDHAVVWGGAVVGGALLLTGVGGAFLAASAAAATTIGTVTAATGVAVGLASSGYYAHDALQSRQAAGDFERAFLAGSGDRTNSSETAAALAKYKEARMEALIQFGGAAVGGALLKVTTAAKAGSTLSSSEFLNKSTAALNTITNDKKFADQVNQLRQLHGLVPDDEIGGFLGMMGQVSEKTRMELISKFKTMPPEAMGKTFKTGLEAANKCMTH